MNLFKTLMPVIAILATMGCETESDVAPSENGVYYTIAPCGYSIDVDDSINDKSAEINLINADLLSNSAAGDYFQSICNVDSIYTNSLNASSFSQDDSFDDPHRNLWLVGNNIDLTDLTITDTYDDSGIIKTMELVGTTNNGSFSVDIYIKPGWTQHTKLVEKGYENAISDANFETGTDFPALFADIQANFSYGDSQLLKTLRSGCSVGSKTSGTVAYTQNVSSDAGELSLYGVLTSTLEHKIAGDPVYIKNLEFTRREGLGVFGFDSVDSSNVTRSTHIFICPLD